MNYILIDMSYFIFYRYYAICAWWRNAKPEISLDLPEENREFIEKFSKIFIDKLREIPKKLKIKDYKIYAALDCPQNEIWRKKKFPEYKLGRNTDDHNSISYFFKLALDILDKLNINTLSGPHLEADDCIALYCKKYSKADDKIYIITSDMDYLQLNAENIKIYNLKYKNIAESSQAIGDAATDLFCKIILGDKSDNISPVFDKCGIKTALKYFNDRELFDKALEKNIKFENQYKLNCQLIDFNNIPEDLANKMIITNN